MKSSFADPAGCGQSHQDELVTIRKARAFFPATRELALLRKACMEWESKKAGVALYIDRFRPRTPCRFKEICAFCIVSDDWPGMGETCLGIVHERGWNVHYAHGLVIERGSTDLGVFIMAIGIEDPNDMRRLTVELPGIRVELLSLGVGRRAKMLLLAREAKKLALLSKVVEELTRQSSGEELNVITAPLGESTKFFAARTDEYMNDWSPREIANQILSNHRFLEKVRSSGGFGGAHVENRTARTGVRTCVTVVGLARDITVEECLRVVGDTLGFHEQHHLREFTTRDGLIFIRLEIGQSGGQPLSPSQSRELELNLKEMLAGRRVAWAHRIEARGGFEQYLRAIIPLLQKEQAASGVPQVYVSPTTREKARAGYKIIFVYGAPADGSKPSVHLTELIQKIPGVHFVSSSSPRSMGDQRLFVININADLSRFQDAEEFYSTFKERIRQVFPKFRDFDEGMRLIDMTKLKGIESSFPDFNRNMVDRIYYAIDDFSRLSMNSDEIVRLIRLGLTALTELDARATAETTPIVKYEESKDDHGDLNSLLLAIAVPHGHGVPNCIRDLALKVQVSVSQIRHGDGELLLSRIAWTGSSPPDQEAITGILRCLVDAPYPSD